MNKEWSELNKLVQANIKKKDTFESGISALFALRNDLMQTLKSIQKDLRREDYDKIGSNHSKGYDNKTIAYSIWHIARIEDIVAHTLINDDEQIFFLNGYKSRINASIITTGNELAEQEIIAFSSQLNINELWMYFYDVKESTEKVLNSLTFTDLKRRFTPKNKDKLLSLNVVSEDNNANWLIDYWCNKDVKGLIQMPFSRHWIMHVEACLRIKNKILK